MVRTSLEIFTLEVSLDENPTSSRFCLFLSTTFGATQMTFTKEQDHMGVISITPKNELDQSCTIVIIHGLGDSAEVSCLRLQLTGGLIRATWEH